MSSPLTSASRVGLVVQKVSDGFQISLSNEQVLILKSSAPLDLRRKLNEFFEPLPFPELLSHEVIEAITHMGAILPQSTVIEVAGGRITVDVANWYLPNGQVRLVTNSGATHPLEVPVKDDFPAVRTWALGHGIDASQAAIRSRRHLINQGLCIPRFDPSTPPDADSTQEEFVSRNRRHHPACH